ncbi:hypothetical protein WJX84_010615, partial [Apatococcus fuscideae]
MSQVGLLEAALDHANQEAATAKAELNKPQEADETLSAEARSEELASARAIADELQQKLEEARAEHQELTEKLAAANKANEEAAQEASKANEKLQQQLQASEKRSAQLEEELLQARKLLESQQQASRRSQEVNETVRAGMAAEVGRLAHESKHASEALAREQEAALSAVKKLEEQLEIQPRESVDPENLARRRSEALEAVQKLEEEVIACKLSMADRIEGRIAAEARAADFAIDADVANLKSQRTSQQLSRASAELERTRRDSADTFEQLQRSSAELRRSSAELQRMRRPSGSLGPLQSLDEGTEKAVQLVLQIISDTATTGTVPGIDQAMFTKLAKENESLKGRIGELGSLLSSNTIGASSARRPSTSGDAEPKPDVKLHDMANTTQEMWEATASLDQPSGSKAESSVTGKEDLLQGPSETTSESTESSLLDNVPSGACEHDDTSFLTRPASHSGASSSTAKQPQAAPFDALDRLWFGRPASSPAGFSHTPTPPRTYLLAEAHMHQMQEEDSAQEGHAAEDVSISSQQASRAATFAKKLPSHQELGSYAQQRSDLSDQVKQLESEMQAARHQLSQAQAAASQQKDELSSQDRLQEADEALDGLRTDIAAKEEELTTLRSGYGSLRQRATEVAQPAAIHQDPEPAVTLHITISSQPGQDATSAVVTKPSRPQVSLPEGPSLEAQLPASTLVSPSPANSLPEIAEQSLDAAVASAVQMGAVKATANGHSNEAASKASDSQELAEVKRKFLLVMKKKQQEFVKKVKELEAATEEATSRSKQLEQQLLDFRERGSEQQTARSVATSELTDMHGKHEAEAASLQEQIAQQREAAEQAESRAQAAHTEAAELKASSTADLRMKEEAWQARHTDLEAEVNKLKQDVEAERASRAKLREEVEGERERVKKAITELKRKTDRALRDCKKAEQDAEAVKSKAEAEKEELRDEIVAAEKHDQQAQQGVKLLEAELRDYKARAHLLLKAKDAELKTAADSVRDSYADQLSDAEASAAEARTTADQERQNAHRWQEQLQEGLAEQHRQHELEARHLRGDIAREQAGHQDVLKTCEAWRVRAEAAEARAEALKEERRRAPDASPAVLQQHADELHALQLRLEQLK